MLPARFEKRNGRSPETRQFVNQSETAKALSTTIDATFEHDVRGRSASPGGPGRCVTAKYD
eukprot:6805061-Prymnesium_polylepis.1